jgi:hypothetical protein
MTVKRPEYWLIWTGLVLMAFGAGGFLGFAAGRVHAEPPSMLNIRAESHANAADYLARRLTIGVSKLEKSDPSCRKPQESHVQP